MSYQVLARKWRPRSFGELVGQEHVVRVLTHALDSDRLHHAFLFTGTRGVGKTTIARILAKCLNCEQGVTSTPCGECSTCCEIDEGRFVDLIEVDAASRTKVDETRELLENVPYAPTRGRYKVYLIDEVHMFSGHSFNALLKTLEEPPPHVKFLLATTDPQKLPITILSRCLQFNLRRLAVDRIAAHLEKITGSEGIEAETAAHRLLAVAADGSVRDSLSLLDQAIAFGGGALTEGDVRSMLGGIDRGRLYELLALLAQGDGPALMECAAGLADQGPDFDNLLGETASLLQRVAMAQQVPDAVDDDLGDRDRIMALAEKLSPEDTQLFYQIALFGRRDLPLSFEPRTGFEMTLLRMLAFRPTGSGAVRKISATAATPQTTRSVTASDTTSVPPPASAAPARDGAQGWSEMVEAMALSGLTREMALNAVMAGREGGTVRLQLNPEQAHLRSDMREKQLCEALSGYYSEPVKLEITVIKPEVETPAMARKREEGERQQVAEESIAVDPVVRGFKETFGAEVVPNSVRPAD